MREVNVIQRNDYSTDFKHSSPPLLKTDQNHQRIAIGEKAWLQESFVS